MNINYSLKTPNLSLNFKQKIKTIGKAIPSPIFKKGDKKAKNKGAVKEFIAKLSKGLMLPIAMLPIAGVFLGVGSAIVSNADKNEALKTFGNFLSVPGNAVFGALPLLFAIAIAIAFTGDAGPAALACLIGYIVFGSLQDALSNPVTGTVNGVESVIGYDLLFYKGNILHGISPQGISPKDNATIYAGLPSSLYGTVIGINQLQSSVFGGFIVGFVVAFLYNKYKNIKLHPIIGFFNGVRFVPIVTFLSLFPITIIFLIIWPLIGVFLTLVGKALGSAVGVNSFVFGFLERSLVPFGLHHAFYSPLWYTAAGGSADLTQQAVIFYEGKHYALFQSSDSSNILTWQQLITSLPNNKNESNANVASIAGDQTMWAFFNKYLLGQKVYMRECTGSNKLFSIVANSQSILHTITWSDLTSGQLSQGGANGFEGVNIGQYLQGKYVFMIMGLPFAALAMVMAAPKENRKLALSICMSAGFTSFLTGITEPLEYTFLFLAPWLFWGVHAFLCALAFGLMNWIGLIMTATGHPGLAPHIGMSFSGGLLDWVIYGGIQIQYGSNAWWALVFGIAYAPIYYFLFYFLIKKFNIQTPGRGENVKLFTKADYNARNSSNNAEILNLNLTPNQLHALDVVNAYGGFDNIKNVDACITKLRIQIENQSIVDTKKLVELGAKGTAKPSPQSVYAVFGTDADIIKGDIKTLIENISRNPILKNEYNNIMNGIQSDKKEEIQTNTQKVNDDSKVISELAKEKVIINSPFTGEIVSMSKVPDETFSSNMMGVGIAVKPKTGKIYSPINGKISLIFGTKHAYTFETEKGTQILVHIGVDSINLKDKNGNKVDPFTSSSNAGDLVKVGQEVGNIKLSDLKYAKSTISPIIALTETLEGREIKLLKKSGEVKKGEPLFELIPKKK